MNLAFAVPVALRVRLMRRQRLLTTILVLPITLGTVFVADGLLTFLGPRGWFNRDASFCSASWIAPVKLTNNYWGVFASLLITGASLRLPADAVLCYRYRPGDRAGCCDARRAMRAPALLFASSCRCWCLALP